MMNVPIDESSKVSHAASTLMTSTVLEDETVPEEDASNVVVSVEADDKVVEQGEVEEKDGRPQPLPLASASKIMTVKLQERGFAMSKDARETVSDAATIFILYLATTCV